MAESPCKGLATLWVAWGFCCLHPYQRKEIARPDKKVENLQMKRADDHKQKVSSKKEKVPRKKRPI
jgi:hypothetical protein